MYAVIGLAGKQYRVREGERLVVDRLPHEAGAAFTPRVLLAADGKRTLLDAKALAKVSVSVRVCEHRKAAKIRVLRYHPKSHWTKRRGHRSHVTVIQVERIVS